MDKNPRDERKLRHQDSGHNLENTVPTLGISGTETHHETGIHSDADAEEIFKPKANRKSQTSQ